MSNIILQPSGSNDARKHFNDTIELPVKLSKIEQFLDQKEIDELSQIYPDNQCRIWGVTSGGNNVTKWDRIKKGDVTLFSKDGVIFASAVTTYKTHNKKLAEFLWDYNSNGQTWEYTYFLDEDRRHNIPYINFNKAVGYKENYIIQGFGVLDKIKSEKVFQEFGLRSSIYIEPIDETTYSEIALNITQTEQEFTSKRRLEQGYLRKKLFENRTSSACSCCGKEYPISMLWCSHIKKRSKCNDNEKRDFNVVIPMCRFGCDELFEKGFIGVDSDGKIIQLKKCNNNNVASYIKNLNKLDCIGFNELNSKYFEWHRKFHS